MCSTMAFCIFLGALLVSWKSKQDIAACSSTKTKYRAMTDIVVEEISHLLFDMSSCSVFLLCYTAIIRVWSTLLRLQFFMNIPSISRSTIILFVIFIIALSLSLPYIPTTEQIVDSFTKAHIAARFKFLLGKLSMWFPVSLRGGSICIHEYT